MSYLSIYIDDPDDFAAPARRRGSREWTKRSGKAKWSASLAIVLLLVIPAGCGGSNRAASSSKATPSGEGTGSLKAIHWDIVRLAQRSVKIGAFVPHCEAQKPVPHIEQIRKRRLPGRIILTMLVRFPPRQAGCQGVGISVGRWVKVGRNPLGLKFFDGKTSPPEEVQVG